MAETSNKKEKLRIPRRPGENNPLPKGHDVEQPHPRYNCIVPDGGFTPDIVCRRRATSLLSHLLVHPRLLLLHSRGTGRRQTVLFLLEMYFETLLRQPAEAVILCKPAAWKELLQGHPALQDRVKLTQWPKATDSFDHAVLVIDDAHRFYATDTSEYEQIARRAQRVLVMTHRPYSDGIANFHKLLRLSGTDVPNLQSFASADLVTVRAIAANKISYVGKAKHRVPFVRCQRVDIPLEAEHRAMLDKHDEQRHLRQLLLLRKPKAGSSPVMTFFEPKMNQLQADLEVEMYQTHYGRVVIYCNHETHPELDIAGVRVTDSMMKYVLNKTVRYAGRTGTQYVKKARKPKAKAKKDASDEDESDVEDVEEEEDHESEAPRKKPHPPKPKPAKPLRVKPDVVDGDAYPRAEYITGKTSTDDVARICDRFNQGVLRVLVVSSKANLDSVRLYCVSMIIFLSIPPTWAAANAVITATRSGDPHLLMQRPRFRQLRVLFYVTDSPVEERDFNSMMSHRLAGKQLKHEVIREVCYEHQPGVQNATFKERAIVRQLADSLDHIDEETYEMLTRLYPEETAGPR
jgi:hypothetical protein